MGSVYALSIHADYRCRHSGKCCSADWDVPVELPIYRSLQDALATGRLAVATDAHGLAPFVVDPDLPDDAGAIFERTDRGACVFFERGPNLCIVLRDLGEGALAATCRHFPRLAVCDARGVSAPAAAALLPRYQGVKRRQELRGEVAGVTLIDDFGHHPTAVRETLAALTARYPGRRIVAVMEPRSNTSRRAVVQAEYARAFDGAARAVIARVPDAPIYSALGGEPERLNADALAADLTARGVPSLACDGVDAIVEHLADVCRAGDVVVTLSNGGFGGIWEKLLARLSKRSH